MILRIPFALGYVLIALTLASSSGGDDQRTFSDADLRRLLQQKLADDANHDKRYNAAGSKIGLLTGHGVWFALYPIHYAEARLISRGSNIVDPLLRILGDPKSSPQMRRAAGGVLGNFNDPRILKAYVDAAKSEHAPALGLTRSLLIFLPHPPIGPNDGLRWLEMENAKGYETVVLELLDRIMDPAATDEPLEYHGVDIPSLRWLNRFYDQDFDEWLAKVAPRALAFRNAQLSRGYDPLVLHRLVNVRVGELDEALRQGLFSRREDRIAFKQLMIAFYDDTSPLHPPRSPSWPDRLRDWYWKNRHSFVFDRGKQRFILRSATQDVKSSRGD